MRQFITPSGRRIKDSIFAIESSCDDTCFSIIKLTNEVVYEFRSSQKKLHQPFGGVVPQFAALGHRNFLYKLLDRSLIHEYMASKKLKFIAVTTGPGIGSCLATGFDFARLLARSISVPLVPVNHLLGHLISVDYKEIKTFPRLSLIVSGGNTQLVYSRSVFEHHILGLTIDDAIGEALDKTARLLKCNWSETGGLGRELEKIASRGKPLKFNCFSLNNYGDPISFSFSGLKTALRSFIEDREQEMASKEDLAATIQETFFGHIFERVINCFKIINNSKFDIKIFSLIGGVASNKLLQERLSALCLEHNVRLVVPEASLCTDNSIMIGLAANMIYSAYESKIIPKPTRIDPNWNLEEISINKYILN